MGSLTSYNKRMRLKYGQITSTKESGKRSGWPPDRAGFSSGIWFDTPITRADSVFHCPDCGCPVVQAEAAISKHRQRIHGA